MKPINGPSPYRCLPIRSGALVSLLLTVSLGWAPFTAAEGIIAQQHDITRQSIDDAASAIAGDIGEVQDVMDALTASPAADPPCGTGTGGQRFVVNGDWVCDNTTGLQWQTVPNKILSNGYDCLTPTNRLGCSWEEARVYCASIGPGFRLPDPFELVGVVDYSQEAVEVDTELVHGPVYALDPNGPADSTTSNTNPFDFGGNYAGGGSPNIWTRNEVAWASSLAIYVGFNVGFLDNAQKEGPGGLGATAWCVHEHDEDTYHPH